MVSARARTGPSVPCRFAFLPGVLRRVRPLCAGLSPFSDLGTAALAARECPLFLTGLPAFLLAGLVEGLALVGFLAVGASSDSSSSNREAEAKAADDLAESRVSATRSRRDGTY